MSTHNICYKEVQSYLNSSNTDGSFIMANSNSFFSPSEILPISQENIYHGYFREIFLFYLVCCVCALESLYRDDSNKCTQLTIVV